MAFCSIAAAKLNLHPSSAAVSIVPLNDDSMTKGWLSDMLGKAANVVDSGTIETVSSESACQVKDCDCWRHCHSVPFTFSQLSSATKPG